MLRGLVNIICGVFMLLVLAVLLPKAMALLASLGFPVHDAMRAIERALTCGWDLLVRLFWEVRRALTF
ncbi:UBA domain-containing protein [Ramlibacter alkalitolerans]|uniref:Uncharacterized protein n=1 Tax=Ramlibacter alkalitolerans TaxID=2039631 RepID=A0ABS1JVI5_9BURK|nr:hypothetical protein [Ramlibacter alkalitolerans]MBL0427876.1 hypothetical protein [Ramlibacter alkalitolerans]